MKNFVIDDGRIGELSADGSGLAENVFHEELWQDMMDARLEAALRGAEVGAAVEKAAKRQCQAWASGS